MAEETIPVAFISYSWSSREYADRVEQLARDLTSDGVRVLLDQWDLKEGQDKHAFMEKCVADPEVDRVLILVDPRYVERANRREGGVGTETLIISGEVYAQVDQQKFVAVVMERDAEGGVILPIYLKDRIYVDLSDPEHYTEQYERLVRNLHGKPERTRPEVGKRPSYLDSGALSLRTGHALPLFRTAALQDRPGQIGHLEDYFDRFFSAFTDAALDVPGDVAALEQKVSESIDQFLPYRDEFIELLRILARHGQREDLFGRLHALFERMVTYRMSRQPKHWNSEIETENLNFITWELFLYSVGLLLRHNRLSIIERLLRPYYVRSRFGGDGALRQFDIIDSGFRLLQETRQKRLGTRWHSAAAQLLMERSNDEEMFEMLVEADSLLWVRSMLSPDDLNWWPHTAVYREHSGWSGLPVWARAKGDAAYFRELAPILGIVDRNDAAKRVQQLGDQPYVRVGFMSLGKMTVADILGVRDRLTSG